MLSLNLALVSNSAGELDDGVVVGRINKTNPTAVLLGESLVPLAQVIRKAVSATGTIWEDFTTAATNATAGDFAPFGTAADMSAGDAVYFRTQNDVDTHAVYVQISTAGVGIWTLGLQEWSAATEQWEDVTGLADASDGLKAGVGTHKLSYANGAEGLVRLDDTSPKYVWHRLVIKTFTSATTAPVLSRMWVADTEVKHQNITTSFTTGNFSALPTEILPTIGDCITIVHPYKSLGLDVIVSQGASTNFTTQWKYLADDGTYKAFTGVSDETGGLTLVNTAEKKIRWNIPTDWSPKTIKDKDGIDHTGYVTHLEITAIATEGPVAPCNVRGTTRVFGASYTDGIQLNQAVTFKAISIPHIGVPSTSSAILQLLNMNSGVGSSFTIPANSETLNADIDDLAFAANDKLGLAVLSGSLQDVELILQ